jgi:SNF2 family DNA or RNA helicase
MGLAKWTVENGRLALVAPDGRVIWPSAAEIFAAAFQNGRFIQGLEISNPFEGVGISFSRLTAPIAIRASGTFPNARLELGVVTDAGFVPTSPTVDSIVSSGKWYPIHDDDIQVATEWLSAKKIDVVRPPTLSDLIALRLSVDRPFRWIDEATSSSVETAKAVSATIALPEGLHCELYPYQRDGFAFLRAIAAQGIGCVLADEMGLGKTLQVIALFLFEKQEGRQPSLVVVPATLLENWRREIAQFAPSISVLVHAGPSRVGVGLRLREYDVVITSYDTAIRDQPMLQGVVWNVVALDEAQSIKNPDAQRTGAVKSLKRRVSIAVTGTPLENRLTDLWSICDFALPGLLDDIGSFEERFADEFTDADRLAAIVAPIILRRRVAEVAKDLPELIEIPEALRMSQSLAAVYETTRKAVCDEYGGAGNMVALTKLRQVCAHPRLVTEWTSDLAQSMPKYQRLVELLEEIAELKQKALVFCSYQEMTDLLVADCKRRWPSAFISDIDGRTPVEARQPTVDNFSAFEGFGVLVLNPRAAGVGLNITAANHVIHYTPEWNPAVTDQASRRAYRRKQTLPVTVHHLYFVDSVEEIMIERTTFKRELAGHAVTGHAGDVSPSDVLRALEISPLASSDLLEE